MLKQHKALLAGLIVLLIGFAAGVVQLFKLRFERGDVYPAYSSLRADPLGTKAFYESLDALPGISVDRFYQMSHKLPPGAGRTLLFLGTAPGALGLVPEAEAKDLESFMAKGGRIVISLPPANVKPWFEQRREKREQKKKQKTKEPGKPGEKDASKPARKRRASEEGDFKMVSLAERWGVKFDYHPLPRTSEGDYESVIVNRRDGQQLPALLVWHTALWFDQLGKDWRVIYARDDSLRGIRHTQTPPDSESLIPRGEPVLIERPFGNGSLVLSADSYFLSNEAMRKERHPQLLAWLVGASGTVIFDETHLGVEDDPALASLIRKYRLHGVVAGLVILAGLFVWKNSVSFVPPHEESAADGGEVVAGKDSAAGFVNLVRRGIPARDLLGVCLAEWKKSCAGGRVGLADKVARLETLVQEESSRPARERNPVAAYQRMSRILAERK